MKFLSDDYLKIKIKSFEWAVINTNIIASWLWWQNKPFLYQKKTIFKKQYTNSKTHCGQLSVENKRKELLHLTSFWQEQCAFHNLGKKKE